MTILFFLIQLDTVLSVLDLAAWSRAKQTQSYKQRDQCSRVRAGSWLWLACRIMQLRFDIHENWISKRPGY